MLDFMLLNKIVLSCLSGKRDSNPRPSAWEANALPTELLSLRRTKSQNRGPDSLSIERADSRTRTGDPRITNALLYQLSHIGNLSKTSCFFQSGCKGTKKNEK